MLRPSLSAGTALLLAGCIVGPDYQRPSVPMTATYSELTPADYRNPGEWKRAIPADELSRAKWWEIFGDPQLDALGG
jgi:outer membrane protein TolC